MALQTVFVTNRALNRGKDRKKRLFGKSRAKHGAIYFADAQQHDKEKTRRYKINNKISRTCTTIKKTYQLELKPTDQHSSYLQELVANTDNDRPWVFFLHGNNQTLSKNLVKSRKIQDQYQVNMVIFSWPSKSYDPTLISQLPVTLPVAVNPTPASIAKWMVKGAVKKKVRQYKTARIEAEKTVPQFIDAFNLVQNELFEPLKQGLNPHTCLLVHSLGHRVLRLVTEKVTPSLANYQFNSCLLHQADEADHNHQSWVAQLPMVASDHTHVTRNEKDLVLLLSGVVNNHFDFTKAHTRLGNRSNHDSEQGSPVNYLEFSELENVGTGHGIAWDEDHSQQIDDLCRPILTGE